MKHGRGAYARGCRCDKCRLAQREYMREWSRGSRATKRRARTCAGCGTTFPPNGRRVWCSATCKRRSENATRRARMLGAKIGTVERFLIHERDDWTCHICGDPVNRAVKVPELDAPTLDHVVALAAGGAHDEANLKTAHFYCNSVKRELPLTDVA